MNPQPYIDRMLETENLTDMLADPEANLLLDWGSAQMSGLLTGINNEAAANAKASQLMAVMRSINKLMGDRQVLSQDELVQALQDLRTKYRETASPASSVITGQAALPSQDPKLLTVKFSGPDDRSSLELLLNWLKGS